MTGIESAKRKIIRAREHLDNLDRISKEYLQYESAFVIEETAGSKRLRFLIEPPCEIVILAGEIVYQLRSALDHLAFELVKANSSGAKLPAQWEQRCEFPLLLSVPKKGSPAIPYSLPLPYNYFQKSLPGISKEAFRFIERLQPYRRAGSYSMQLGWLGQLANIDKHRHLHVVNATVWQATYSGPLNRMKVLHLCDGAEIQDTHQGLIGPFATFEESALSPSASELPLGLVLSGCLEAISSGVIPQFEELFKSGN